MNKQKILDNKQIVKQLQYILIAITLIVPVLNGYLSIIQVLIDIIMMAVTPREIVNKKLCLLLYYYL